MRKKDYLEEDNEQDEQLQSFYSAKLPDIVNFLKNGGTVDYYNALFNSLAEPEIAKAITTKPDLRLPHSRAHIDPIAGFNPAQSYSNELALNKYNNVNALSIQAITDQSEKPEEKELSWFEDARLVNKIAKPSLNILKEGMPELKGLSDVSRFMNGMGDVISNAADFKKFGSARGIAGGTIEMVKPFKKLPKNVETFEFANNSLDFAKNSAKLESVGGLEGIAIDYQVGEGLFSFAQRLLFQPSNAEIMWIPVTIALNLAYEKMIEEENKKKAENRQKQMITAHINGMNLYHASEKNSIEYIQKGDLTKLSEEAQHPWAKYIMPDIYPDKPKAEIDHNRVTKYVGVEKPEEFMQQLPWPPKIVQQPSWQSEFLQQAPTSIFPPPITADTGNLSAKDFLLKLNTRPPSLPPPELPDSLFLPPREQILPRPAVDFNKMAFEASLITGDSTPGSQFRFPHPDVMKAMLKEAMFLDPYSLGESKELLAKWINHDSTLNPWQKIQANKYLEQAGEDTRYDISLMHKKFNNEFRDTSTSLPAMVKPIQKTKKKATQKTNISKGLKANKKAQPHTISTVINNQVTMTESEMHGMVEKYLLQILTA